MKVSETSTQREARSTRVRKVSALKRLTKRFSHLVSENPDFTRRTVSFQGNKEVPGFRWFKYKEGFSRELVSGLLHQYEPNDVLDPFAGICTTPLIASEHGTYAMGIEIMPVGISVGHAMVAAGSHVSEDTFYDASQTFLKHLGTRRSPKPAFAFPHVAITRGAFSTRSELELAKAREYICNVEDSGVNVLLNLACMSVLEECSFTSKSGQYLRWDNESRHTDGELDSRKSPSFAQALKVRIDEMVSDYRTLKSWFEGSKPDLLEGSSLELLRTIPAGRFDMVITSPPYANRYDYTRTYALELAWLGCDRQGFADLRQRMLSATVENKTKMDWLLSVYGNDIRILDHAHRMYTNSAVQEVVAALNDRASELSNRQVIRLIEGYFLEMSVVIAELGRITRPGGVVIMVNDNVQYHGQEVPVDYILSEFAEQSGFQCTDIWVLPGGKGNSSQQMAKFGRRELRKCVYKWVKSESSPLN